MSLTLTSPGHSTPPPIASPAAPEPGCAGIGALALLAVALVGIPLAAGAQVVLDPVGPPRVLPPTPNVNRPPITYLPARGAPFQPGRLRSWKAIRDTGVVRQAYDYSCGSAALATLLAAAGDPVTEGEILRAVLEELDEEARARTLTDGLTLLDLQRAARMRGHRAEGYRVGPEILAKLTRPVIVYIEPYGYRHFAVLRGIKEARAFLADPARGNVRMPIWRFLDMWQDATGEGVVFVVGLEARSDLAVAEDADPQPELLSARQLIRLGSPRFRPLDAPPRQILK